MSLSLSLPLFTLQHKSTYSLSLTPFNSQPPPPTTPTTTTITIEQSNLIK